MQALQMARSWLLAFRLKTLTAGVVPIAVAAALTISHKGIISYNILLCILASALSIQIATNLFNDAIDFKKGADKKRVGPLRVTQSGLIGETTVFVAAVFFCVLAFLFAIPLVQQGGWLLVAVGLSSLILAYGYTGGPFPLAYLGLGDLFVILYFGIIAVVMSTFLLSGDWLLSSLLLGTQVGALSAVLIALNNLRDRPEDAKVGKRTWAVRWGDSFVRWEITVFLISSYVFMGAWSYHFGQKIFLIYFLSAPLTVKVLKTLFTFRERSELIACLGQSAGIHLFFGVSFVLGSLL